MRERAHGQDYNTTRHEDPKENGQEYINAKLHAREKGFQSSKSTGVKSRHAQIHYCSLDYLTIGP